MRDQPFPTELDVSVPGPDLRALARPAGRCAVAIVAGELDHFSAVGLDRLLEHLAGAGRLDVVADMSRVEFTDTAGLAVIVRWSREYRERGGRLVLRRPPDLLLRIAEVTGDACDLEVEVEHDGPGDRPRLAEVLDIRLHNNPPA